LKEIVMAKKSAPTPKSGQEIPYPEDYPESSPTFEKLNPAEKMIAWETYQRMKAGGQEINLEYIAKEELMIRDF